MGAAVTSRAAAEALGGGSSWRPLRPPLSFLSAVPPPTFPEFSLGLARLEGAEVAAVTGTSWGLRRGGKLLQQRLWVVRVSQLP